MPERPLFVRIDSPTGINLETGKLEGSKWYSENDRFLEVMLERSRNGVSWDELDSAIADWHYRRPIRIPFTGLAIRPFWRDGKKTLPLPLSVEHHQKVVRRKR